MQSSTRDRERVIAILRHHRKEEEKNAGTKFLL